MDCFQSSSNLRDSFTMVFIQNSSIFHWAVHQPITFLQVWSLIRQFEPLTEELWFLCGTIFSSCVCKIAELEVQLVCGECLKRAWSGHWFFSQYCIQLLRKPVKADLLLWDRWQTSAQAAELFYVIIPTLFLRMLFADLLSHYVFNAFYSCYLFSLPQFL